jgi:hypothetical protein
MGLKSDIEEFKDVWKESNILFKVFILITTFLAFSSITSLADTIFSWKGFIKDGIEFYKLWVHLPLIELMDYFGIDFKEVIVDDIIIFSILIFSGIRVANINQPDIPKSHKVMLYFIGIIVIYKAATLMNSGSEDELQDNYYYLFVILVIFLVVPIVVKMPNKLLWYTPIFIATIGTLVLGAINAGLNRTLL